MLVQTRLCGRVLALSACLACISPRTAWSQATNSADVTGSVTDPTGAVVPDVKVIVKDIDKNIERELTTNGSGVYDSGPLAPADHYMITFKKEGFATLERGPLTLNAGVTGLNAQMTLGQATQQVMVETAAPLLETPNFPRRCLKRL